MSLVLCIISIGEWLNVFLSRKAPLEMIASISGEKSQGPIMAKLKISAICADIYAKIKGERILKATTC
jgi:hypothetical protein